jgi:hypothetical protein
MSTQAIAPPLLPDGRGGFSRVSLADIEKMPLSQFEILDGQLVNRQDDFFYDTAYIKAGVAVPANAKQALFAKGKGQTDTQFGSATSMGEKNEFHTNMITGGEFPDGTNFIMKGAGVQCLVSADKATTIAENGQIIAPDYTASVAISAVNNLIAVAENLELQFKRGEDIKKRAPLQFWAGVPGSGLEGANGSPNGGFFQLAQWGLVRFSHPVALESGNRFQFDLVNVGGAAWTPTVGMKIRVVIWGTKITQQYPG